MNQDFDIIIVGGGAAGFFTAINIVEKSKLSSDLRTRRRSLQKVTFWWLMLYLFLNLTS
jgi:predicted flavoprotein YhiN